MEIELKEEEDGEIKKIGAPRLSAEERLYVRAYLSTLSHKKAHELVSPSLKAHQAENKFAKKENVQFHIQLGLQEKAEALLLTPEIIIEKLFKEAIREGNGSNHSARIQALTQLGKYLGMFEEKKETSANVFNIVNYSSDPIKIESVEPDKEILTHSDFNETEFKIEEYS